MIDTATTVLPKYEKGLPDYRDFEHCYNDKNYNVNVYSQSELTENEVRAYVKRGREYYDRYLRNIYIIEDIEDNIENNIEDDTYVNVVYDIAYPKFERIRRITGYITGTLDRWNNAKRSEEKDRVKHRI